MNQKPFANESSENNNPLPDQGNGELDPTLFSGFEMWNEGRASRVEEWPAPVRILVPITYSPPEDGVYAPLDGCKKRLFETASSFRGTGEGALKAMDVALSDFKKKKITSKQLYSKYAFYQGILGEAYVSALRDSLGIYKDAMSFESRVPSLQVTELVSVTDLYVCLLNTLKDYHDSAVNGLMDILRGQPFSELLAQYEQDDESDE
jgi:hypothetical protein